MGVVILDIQHSGKPGNMGERGAGADLDGDGVVENHEREAELTPFYAAACSRALALQGHLVVLETFGHYWERHHRANDLALRFPDVRVAYVACHINAGGGRSGSAFADGRSGGGMRLAASMATQFDGIPELYKGVAFAAYEKPQPGGGPGVNEWRGDTSKHWTWGAWSTIAGVYTGAANISAVCVEPFYLDNPDHKALTTFEGMTHVGEAMARALDDWLQT